MDGVAAEVALRPAPVAVFDDEAGIGEQNEIGGLAGNQACWSFLATTRQALSQKNCFASLRLLTRLVA